MSAALLAGCGSSSSDSKSSDDSKKTEEKADTTKALSATDYNFEPDYYFNTFNTNSLKDKPRQGIKTFKSADEVVYEDITYDELIDLFQKEGTYMIALCGSWCHNSRAMSPFINKYDKEYVLIQYTLMTLTSTMVMTDLYSFVCLMRDNTWNKAELYVW